MALETTELLKEKLKELIKLPRSKTVVTRCIDDLNTFQKTLRGAEADEPIIDRWEELIGDIYSLEDTVESLLCKATPQSQKQLTGHVKLVNKIGKLKGKVRQLFPSITWAWDGEHDQRFPTKASTSDPDNVAQVHSSGKISSDLSEYDEFVAETDSALTKKPEDLQQAKCSLHEDGDDEATNTQGEIRTDSPFSSEEKAETAILENLINELAHPLLSLGTLHFLILRVEISCPGKAILLWAVYNAELVKQSFHVRACINVAEGSGEIDILKAIIKQVGNEKEEMEESLHSLQQRLRNILVWRRYLIVFYGNVLEVLWDKLKSAFPNSLSGSRVILATPHTDGSKPLGEAINGRPRENLMDSSVYLEDSSITTAKSIMDELAESVLNLDRPSFLISVVGVIGSGKTTLLWPMYIAEDVKLHFHRRAWIHVPKDFKEEEVLNDILEQVTGYKTEDGLPIDLLREKLHKALVHKRYLVVLYDVWKAGIWEHIKHALPNTGNGSRVILAVPEVDVARKTNSWIFKITLGKGLFHDFKGLKEIAPAAKRWFDKTSDGDIMEEASGIVGLGDKIREQAQLVFNSSKLHHLISVLGVAGSGKTTLVRTFYNSIAAKQHFNCRAWINVPQDFDERDILLDLSRQLRKEKEKQSLSLEQLQKGLRLFLTWQRYLIVLDDVRSADIWNKLKFTLPNWSNGSRVICTTRNTYLAYHMNPSSVVLALRPLDNEESWKLFFKWVTERSRNREDNGTELETKMNNISPELKEKILRRCHGLPRTILTLGGLLIEKQLEEWHQVIDEISKRGETKEITGKYKLNSGKVIEEIGKRGEKEINGKDKLNSGQVIEETGKRGEKEIIGKDQLNSGQSSSQNEKHDGATETQQTSSNGKYSSIEDIPTPPVPLTSSTIKQKDQETKTQKKEESKVVTETSTSGEDETVDILAVSYSDLSHWSKCCLLYLGLFPRTYKIPIRRLFLLWLADGLVVASSGIGSAKYCFEQLLDRNFIEIAEQRVDGRPKTCRATNSLFDKLFPNAKKAGFFHIHSSPGSLQSTIRRLAGHLEIIPPPANNFRHLRSYISFCKKRGDAPTLGVNELLNNIVNGGFPMLAVLDLEGVYKPLLPEALGKLLMMKYLGLRRTLLDSIPESVGDLPRLETLDIKHTYITSLPDTLWKARKLQHLYMSEITVDVSIRKQSSHGSVSNLQTLWGLIIRGRIPEKNRFDRLVGLRKLKLTCHEASIADVASLTKLESLKLRSISESNEPAELKLEKIGELKNLSRLHLMGMLPRPNLAELPINLETLTLSVSELSKDPMPTLGQLPKLKVLKLYARSYIGNEMTCDGGFPQLQVLKLWMLKDLKKWTVKENTMLELKEVEIRCCKKLENVEGLQELSLKELLLTNMESSFIEKMKQKIGSEKVLTQSFTFAAEWHVEENPVKP